MLFECKSLSSLSNISKWNAKNIINTGGMFNECEPLSSLLDVSK